jgi:hypothetical protein
VPPFEAPQGCPCTTKLLCELDTGGYFTTHRRPIDCSKKISEADVPSATGHLSLNGGAGALISVGLMRALDYDEAEYCVATIYGDRGVRCGL